MINKEKPVLVTGGSGYIASWVVKQLLEQGYKVHATVRNKSRKEKVEHLLKMQGDFPNQLELFEADLLKEGSFAAAMENCELVIHMASPFVIRVKDAQKQLVDPALKGTQNVLQQANVISTVKRIVLTSSVVAIYGDASDIEKTNHKAFTEADWNTTSTLKHQPYAYSKTVAEKAAWDIQKAQKNWDLVVINPAFVMGPSLSKRIDGESTEFMLNLLTGKLSTGAPDLTFGYVDVRDVAAAHILAGTKETAKGRHITCATSKTMLETAAILKEEFGNKFKFPSSQLPKFMMYLVGPMLAGMSWKFINGNVGYNLQLDNSYSKENLGLSYRPIKETLVDHANQLLDAGLVK